MDNTNELGKWLKMFFGLAFISPEEVVDAFHELISICPNDDGFVFSDYILHNYIEDHCQFPPNIWAENPSLNPRFLHYFLKITIKTFFTNLYYLFNFLERPMQPKAFIARTIHSFIHLTLMSMQSLGY